MEGFFLSEKTLVEQTELNEAKFQKYKRSLKRTVNKAFMENIPVVSIQEMSPFCKYEKCL
jgi:hypothetical protein